MSAFLVFGNQIARFSKRTAHLALPIVRKGSLNRKKSQSKIDQDFRRNRKTAKKGVIVKNVFFETVNHRIILSGHGKSQGVKMNGLVENILRTTPVEQGQH